MDSLRASYDIITHAELAILVHKLKFKNFKVGELWNQNEIHSYPSSASNKVMLCNTQT